jgi:hypothetical protein
MKKEIIKYLTMKRKDLPLKKQILCFISISAIVVLNSVALRYLTRSQIFSPKGFIYFVTIYLLVLLGLAFIINREGEKLAQQN